MQPTNSSPPVSRRRAPLQDDEYDDLDQPFFSDASAADLAEHDAAAAQAAAHAAQLAQVRTVVVNTQERVQSARPFARCGGVSCRMATYLVGGCCTNVLQ